MIRLHNTKRSAQETAIFFADYVSDIELLPNTTSKKKLWYGTVPMGSKCLVLETGEEYRLTSNDEWVLMPINLGGGSESGTNIIYATDAEVDEVLDGSFK